MKDDCVIAFDLHNTLINSNAAWVKTYMELCANANKAKIVQMIYNKESRKKISSDLGLNHSEVLEKYLSISKEKTEIYDIFILYNDLGMNPLIISSANRDIVFSDVKSSIGTWVDKKRIYYREIFNKKEIKDWIFLLAKHHAKRIIYYGNDITEDFVDDERIISVLRTRFLVDKKANN